MSCSLATSISHFFSTVSLGSWICAQSPQIYTNYKNKSAEGISPLFLVLWFMGDFLSFTSCLFNTVVLKFQVYLSLFFICNDIALCYQYYYYNSVYPRKQMMAYEAVSVQAEETATSEAELFAQSEIHNRQKTNNTDSSSLLASSPSGSYDSVNGGSFGKALTVGAVLSSVSNAMSTESTDDSASENFGLFLAWCCTIVYVGSRCPQLYKNYLRKSVEGMSPLLFGAALIGNITYTLSILTSCDFLMGDSKSQFFMRELPYILGSSGTIVFDMAYFYQRHIYRNAGGNTSTMGLETWSLNTA